MRDNGLPEQRARYNEPRPIVYVADDDVHTRGALRGILQSVGLESQGFGSSAEFMAAPRADRLACLILDVRLPERGGFHLQAELGLSEPDLPIIVMSPHADIRMAVKAMQNGAVDFLSKPFRDQEFIDAVQSALRRARAHLEAEMNMRNLRERYDSLTSRQKQVVDLVSAGLRNKQIAAEMGIAEITVKVHRVQAMKKLKLESTVDLVRLTDAIRVL